MVVVLGLLAGLLGAVSVRRPTSDDPVTDAYNRRIERTREPGWNGQIWWP